MIAACDLENKIAALELQVSTLRAKLTVANEAAQRDTGRIEALMDMIERLLDALRS